MKKTKWQWSTHQPLLKALIKTFSPDFIVELGCGIYSTPIFLNSTAKSIHVIENDKLWLSKISDDFGFDDRCKVTHHDLGEGINLATELKEFSEDKKIEIKNYFLNLGEAIKDINLPKKMLFVDQFRCSRNLSINVLYKNFDVIAYHDAEASEWYGYDFDKTLYDNFNFYMLKTPTSWTGCFIKKEYNIEKELFDNIIPYIAEYCESINETQTGFYLEKL